MKLTEEQAKAVNLFKSSKSLKISAFAGTGKTSTLVELAKSTTGSGLYLAFNRSIAVEAAGKFPSSVDCRTTHSLAFRAASSKYRTVKGKLTDPLHSNKVAQLLDIEEIAAGGIVLRPRALGHLTAKTIQRFCQSGDEIIMPKHVPLTGKLNEISPRHREDFKMHIGQLAAKLWLRMLDPSDAAPLGHDGYLKLWSLSKPKLNYDFLLLDEAQDTNEAVLGILREQDSHLTLVGDRYQQIYEWRGAINAMASVDTHADAFLTQSFRFGNELASAASSILRVLGEPRIMVGDPNRTTKISGAGKTRAILCRTNAGVVDVVVSSLAERRRPHVIGGVGDFVRMLEDVTRLKRNTPAESQEFFGFSGWDEVVAFSKLEEGESLKSFVRIVEAHGEVGLIQQLSSVASDEATADLIVSTGHKAKGREWDSVTLGQDFDIRLSKDAAQRPVINEEEARLLYVAVTRARDLLVVPARLAEKWNANLGRVDVAPETAELAPKPVYVTTSTLPTPPRFEPAVKPPAINPSPSRTANPPSSNLSQQNPPPPVAPGTKSPQYTRSKVNNKIGIGLLKAISSFFSSRR